MRQLFVFTILIVLIGCNQKTNEEGLNEFCKNQLEQCNDKLTKILITDVFSPPVCSRIYAYCNIAAYEANRPSDKKYPSYSGLLNDLQPIPQPLPNKEYCYPISSAIAFFTVAQKLVFNGDMANQMEKQYLKQLDSVGVSKDLLNYSVEYGRLVGQHILGWASKDGYLQRNSNIAYIVTSEEGRWLPTPPDYMDAVEPNWRTLRPFVLDTVSQFRPGPPLKYDTVKTSAFYKQAYEVYKAVKNPESGDSATAWYWDDNPNTSVTQGHITYFQQKISPPGHWVHIACHVAGKENYDALKTAFIVSQTSIALADAFISCWEAKYHYTYIRPETYINKYIDKDWEPLIQTPPFPEYTSGHSCISASAATILTKTVGDNYSFIDFAEVPYGRPIRHFKSFFEAAEQASLSRLYGGIHFREALETGNKQGKLIGEFIATRLNK